MRKAKKNALDAAVALCFIPASLWLFVFFQMFLIDVANQDKPLTDRLESLLIVFGGVAGVIAAAVMLQFMEDGRRALSTWVLLLCSGSGLIVSGWATLNLLLSRAPVAFVLVTAAPFVCGVLLLYLGRSYMKAANQPLEPTR